MEKTKNKDLFESMPIAKAVMKMAIPTIIGQLIVLIYNMADTFFIGRTNNPDMVAGASLILPVFNITLSVACLSGVGGSSLVSRLLGESKEKEARKVYSFCVYFSLLMGAIFSLAVFFFMEPLLFLLGADADTFEFAKSYTMCVIVFGGIPTIISNILSNFVRSIGESGKAGLGITLGGILNIILDPIFMFYILPRGNEILGAGIATFISNCISCLYYVIVIKSFGKGCLLHLLPIYDLPAKQSILKIAEIGVPASISTLLFDLDYIIIDKLMSGYGNISLAAMGIVLKAERLPLNIGIGICQGMVPIIAYNYSFGNYKRMKSIARFSLLCGVCAAVVSISLYELFAPQIMCVFIAESETVRLGTSFLRARCLATVFMFASFYHVNLFNGYGRGKESLFLGVMRWAVFNIPMLFILNAAFGQFGIVYSQLCADILTVILSVYVHRRYEKKYLS